MTRSNHKVLLLPTFPKCHVIGVPVFAVAINLINRYTMNSLRKKGLETSLDHYYVGNVEKISNKNTKPLKELIKSKFKSRKNKKEK